MYRTGVHPAVAGVIVGWMTPAVSWHRPQHVVDIARDQLGSSAPPDSLESMKQLHRVQSERHPPAERLEHAVHPWVVFVIMPLFAFANAGVDVRTVQLAAHPTLALGIAAGMLLGKPLGILAASGLAVRLRLASLPTGLTWRGVAVVSAVAGIGFTMALFVAELAFAGRTELYGSAKLVVLLSSAAAAAAGLVLGRVLLGRTAAEAGVRSERRDRSRFVPELERGPLAYVLLVFGVVCAALELFDPDRVHGRLVLFVVVAAAGILGIVRRRRPS